MLLGQGDPQKLRQVAQRVALRLGQEDARQFKGVDRQVVEQEPVSPQEAQVHLDVVPDDGVGLHKADDAADQRREAGGLVNVGLRDADQLLNLEGHGALRFDQAGEGLQDLIAREFDQADLDDVVV